MTGPATARMGDEDFELRTAIRGELSGQNWMLANSLINEARRARGREEEMEKALFDVQSQAAGHADEFSGNVWRIAAAALAGKP